MPDDINFTRQLIKGRITETIFEHLIRNGGRFTIIPFGYEHTVPTLAQYQHLSLVNNVLQNIKDAPDFLLISEDKKEVMLVEVKYRSRLDLSGNEIRENAVHLAARWPESWLFLATPKMFTMTKSSEVAARQELVVLSEEWASAAVQREHLKILNEFITFHQEE